MFKLFNIKTKSITLANILDFAHCAVRTVLPLFWKDIHSFPYGDIFNDVDIVEYFLECTGMIFNLNLSCCCFLYYIIWWHCDFFQGVSKDCESPLL